VRLYYRIMRFLCQVVFFLLWRVRVYGLVNVPQDGAVVLACSHQSFLDPVLATMALPRECHYMARDTLFRNRWFRLLIESLNAFPVKRDSADVGAIKEILRRLRDGQLVVTFPEGTRTLDGGLQPLREGSLLVAKRAKATIVPTVIYGAFQCWPRSRRLPRPGAIHVAYGPAIKPAEVEAASVSELSDRTSAALRALHSRIAHKHARDRRL